jgi:hypothetical protein
MAGGAAGGLIGALVDLGLPEETAGNYAEGVRRGGILVTVRTEDHQAEDARRIMNRHGVINLEDRVRNWREEGWTGYRADTDDVPSDIRSSDELRTGSVSTYGTGQTTEHPQGVATGGDDYHEAQRTDQPLGMATGGDLQTGSNVSHTTGQTSEHPQGIATGGDAYDEPQSTEHPQGIATGGEQPELSSTAMHSHGHDSGIASEHPSTGMTDAGSTFSYDDRFTREYDPYFRQDYGTRYASRGQSYEYYRPGYYYGYQLATSDRYRGRSWDEVEVDARRDWESRYSGQGAWEDFKDSVRDAWNRVSEGVRETFDTDTPSERSYSTQYDDRFSGTYDPYFREHFTTTYVNRGHNYDYYRPAYYYGYQLAGDDRYRDWSWEDLEPEARRDWETRYRDQGAWEDFKDAVQHAWMRVKQGVRETFD